MTRKSKIQPSNGRKLRSKVENPKKLANLFNFENVNGLLYRNESISINPETSYNSPYVYFGDTELPQVHGTREIKRSETRLPRRTKVLKETLEDSTYELFYKKMKKEEKVMTNEERSRILNEVDNFQTQMRLLNQYDWTKHLPEITNIIDPKDHNELEYKKNLTIQEIEKLLRKFENWKKRSEDLNNDIKNYHQESSEEPDEYTCSLEVLRERRRKERTRKFGPTIKLSLNNGYTLIIDPINPPKIVRSNTPERDQSTEEEDSPIKEKGITPSPPPPPLASHATPPTPPLTNSRPRHRFKQRQSKLEDFGSVKSINFGIGEESVFGTKFSDLGSVHEEFKLPSFARARSESSRKPRNELLNADNGNV